MSSIIMVLEQGNTAWQCMECGTTTFEFEDFAYGHDCEPE